MIIFYTAGVVALLILVALHLVSELHEDRHVATFTLGPAWTMVDAPGRHRAAPAPDRDWVIA